MESKHSLPVVSQINTEMVTEIKLNLFINIYSKTKKYFKHIYNYWLSTFQIVVYVRYIFEPLKI